VKHTIRLLGTAAGVSVYSLFAALACSTDEKTNSKRVVSRDAGTGQSSQLPETKKIPPQATAVPSATATSTTAAGAVSGAVEGPNSAPEQTPVDPPADTLAQIVNGQVPQLAFEVTGADFEGPLWHPDGYLLVSEKSGKRILRWTPGGGAPTVFSNLGKKSNGLTFDSAGNLYACEDAEQTVAKFGATGNPGVPGKRVVLADKSLGKKFIGPNDCVMDSQDAMYFSDPWYGGNALGGLNVPSFGVYSLVSGAASAAASLLVANFVPSAGQESRDYEAGKGAPNGVALSPDESKLYVASTGQNKIWAFSKQGESYGNPTSLVTASSVLDLPDGLKVDAQGHIFVATTKGVTVLRSSGELIGHISVGGGIASLTLSNVAFGGAQFKTLFMTSGTKVYKIDLAVRGSRPWKFTTHLPENAVP